MPQSTVPAQLPLVADDRILRETRWLAQTIIPFLVGGFFLLYLWPMETGDRFAWKIASAMTAMTLASAYVGGIYHFSGVLMATRWQHVSVGLLPVTAFASILGLATLLHWSRFNHGTLTFLAWAGLYFTAPFVVPAVWWRNRGADPGLEEHGDVVIPLAGRGAVAVVGVIALVVSLLLLLRPDAVIVRWPWPMAPLEARVTAAMFALPGVVGLGIAVDSRWSSARLILKAQAWSILSILIAAVRARDEFSQSNPVTYFFVGGLMALLIGIVAAYRVMESRRGCRDWAWCP